MKQIHYIIASLFAMLCISSCEIIPGSYITNERGAAGLFAFEKVEADLLSRLASLHLFLRFDAYLQAEKTEQAHVLKNLLRGYEFYEEADTICFRSGSAEWRIVRASTDSLSSPHAAWRLWFQQNNAGSDDDEMQPSEVLTITGNKQRNTWVMDVVANGSFEIKKLTDHKLLYNNIVNEYTIATVQSTVAHIEEENFYSPTESHEYFRINYQVTKPFYLKPTSNDSFLFFEKGAAELDVEHGVPPVQKDHVSGEIDKSNVDFINIHFRGVTERLPRDTYGHGSSNGGF